MHWTLDVDIGKTITQVRVELLEVELQKIEIIVKDSHDKLKQRQLVGGTFLTKEY
jgi:hypothetical protein